MATGLVAGAAALAAVLIVWVRSQQFGVGGGVLSLVGVILIGLSVWSRINVEVTPEGIKATLEGLERRVEQVAEATGTVADAVGQVAHSVEVTQTQFNSLTQILERPQQLTPERLRSIRRPVEVAAPLPAGDAEQLERARLLMIRPNQP
ncbi:MAG TPA: hypothetical protein VK933_10290 [Longimicrobiales bacterium]|nr:hypothetical protein [Longimicrobiales bacterium]